MNVRTCLAIGLLACTCAQAAPRATIALLPEVQAGGDAVLLGQVAHLSSPELSLLRQLVHLPLGHLPRDGQAALLRREAVAQWVRQETGLQPGELAFQGSEVVRVAQPTRHVSGLELAQAAIATLRAWLAERGLAAQLRVARLPRDFDVARGDVQLRPRSLESAALRSRMLVWVEVWSDGAFVRAVPVPLELETTLLAAGSAAPVAPPGASPRDGVAAPRSPVLAERGAWATLRSTDGVVSLESRVTVLQDGRAGEHVRVRAPGGGGIVFARVVGPAELELAP